MSSRDRAGNVLEALTGSLRDDDAGGSGASFMRGLTLGALIGAAIAGSALWQRRVRNARRDVAARSETDPDADAGGPDVGAPHDGGGPSERS